MAMEEDDYQEALRRIKEAEENKDTALDLSELEFLTRFPPELARLTSLQSLKLAGCEQLSDLSPLAVLTSLRELDLSRCTGIRHFASLEPLPAGLRKLYLYGCRFDDLPIRDLRT
jgi:Leucine-rich repeat (LRR) protein